MLDADYLVQVSDTEGFCYSIYEALQVDTPCIVTDFPSAFEQVKDGKSGYILKMDLSNLDIDKIYNKIPTQISFTEKSTEEDWIKLFKNVPKAKKIKKASNVEVKDKIAQQRGFATYTLAKNWINTSQFMNLGHGDKTEFKAWLDAIK
jgi:glycosyltransferase involved in cell wall biosynthesis